MYIILKFFSYYGSFLGIQKHFKFNIADDLDYLLQSDHLMNPIIASMFDDSDTPYMNFGSRSNKQKLEISEDIEIEDIEGIEVENLNVESELKEDVRTLL